MWPLKEVVLYAGEKKAEKVVFDPNADFSVKRAPIPDRFSRSDLRLALRNDGMAIKSERDVSART